MPYRSTLWRVIFYFTLASVAVTALVAVAVIIWSYQQQNQAYEKKLADIELSYTTPLATSLWFYDDTQLKNQIQGIRNLGGILYIRISDNTDLNIENGERPHISQIHRLPLQFKQQSVGMLELAFDHELVLHNALELAINTLLAQLASLFLLAMVLGFIVYHFFTRRLTRLALEVEERRASPIFTPLDLGSSQNDEIGTLIQAFNALSAKTNTELRQKIQAQQQLKIINLELEDRVRERTQSLQSTVSELNETLSQLHATQSKLVESEKLSALGAMVAGVAHEINTPLGLAITMHSFMQENFNDIRKKFAQGGMTKQNLEDFFQQLSEGLAVLDKNHQRAALLIKSFKQISEDQTGDYIRKLNLQDYIHEILETLSPKLKKTSHQISVNCSATLWAQTYAGAVSQVLTNLIMNALLHAFENQEHGHIQIDASEDKGLIYLHFYDDGVGLSAQAKLKIFEPFYTTKRGQGGTGLGMHLVYNLIHQRLKGDIQIENREKGTGFIIRFPQINPDAAAPDN